MHFGRGAQTLLWWCWPWRSQAYHPICGRRGKKVNFAKQTLPILSLLPSSRRPSSPDVKGRWRQIHQRLSGGKHTLSRILLICPYLEILTHGTARTENQEIFPGSKTLFRLPCWLRGKDSACQCRRHGFHPWPGKISCVTEHLGPHSTTLEARVPWGPCSATEAPEMSRPSPAPKGSPCPLRLEKSPPSNEDPAQPT